MFINFYFCYWLILYIFIEFYIYIYATTRCPLVYMVFTYMTEVVLVARSQHKIRPDIKQWQQQQSSQSDAS